MGGRSGHALPNSTSKASPEKRTKRQKGSMGNVLPLMEQSKRHLWKYGFSVLSATLRLSLHVFWNSTNSWDFPEQRLEAILSHFPLFKSRSLLRDEPIFGAELRGWTLGLAPAAQHVRTRTTSCSSNVLQILFWKESFSYIFLEGATHFWVAKDCTAFFIHSIL